MKVTVRYFASIREAMGVGAESIETDARTLARKIGYVMGAGDEVPRALRQMGCEITPLSAEDLARGDLSPLTQSSPRNTPTWATWPLRANCFWASKIRPRFDLKPMFRTL